MPRCEICGLLNTFETEVVQRSKGESIPTISSSCPEAEEAKRAAQGGITVAVPPPSEGETVVATLASISEGDASNETGLSDASGCVVFGKKSKGRYTVELEVHANELCMLTEAKHEEVKVESNETTLIKVAYQRSRKLPSVIEPPAPPAERLCDKGGEKFIEAMTGPDLAMRMKTWEMDEQNGHVCHNAAVKFLEGLAAKAEKGGKSAGNQPVPDASRAEADAADSSTANSSSMPAAPPMAPPVAPPIAPPAAPSMIPPAAPPMAPPAPSTATAPPVLVPNAPHTAQDAGGPHGYGSAIPPLDDGPIEEDGADKTEAEKRAEEYTIALQQCLVEKLRKVDVWTNELEKYFLRHTLLGEILAYNPKNVAHTCKLGGLSMVGVHPSYWGLFLHGPGYVHDVQQLRDGVHPIYRRTPPDGTAGLSLYRTPGHGRDDFLTVCKGDDQPLDPELLQAFGIYTAWEKARADYLIASIPIRKAEAFAKLESDKKNTRNKWCQVTASPAFQARTPASVRSEAEYKTKLDVLEHQLTELRNYAETTTEQTKEFHRSSAEVTKTEEDAKPLKDQIELARGLVASQKDYLTFCTKGTGLDMFRDTKHIPSVGTAISYVEDLIKAGGNENGHEVLACFTKKTGTKGYHGTAGYCASKGDDIVTKDFEAFQRVVTGSRDYLYMASVIADPLAVVAMANVHKNRRLLQAGALELAESSGLPAQIVTVAPGETPRRMRDYYERGDDYRFLDQISEIESDAPPKELLIDDQTERVEYVRAMSAIKKAGLEVPPALKLDTGDMRCRLQNQQVATAYALTYAVLASLAILQKLGMCSGSIGDSFERRNISSAVRDSDDWDDMIRQSYLDVTTACNDLLDTRDCAKHALLSCGIKLVKLDGNDGVSDPLNFLSIIANEIESQLLAVATDVFGYTEKNKGQGGERLKFPIKDLCVRASDRTGAWEEISSTGIARLVHDLVRYRSEEDEVNNGTNKARMQELENRLTSFLQEVKGLEEERDSLTKRAEEEECKMNDEVLRTDRLAAIANRLAVLVEQSRPISDEIKKRAEWPKKPDEKLYRMANAELAAAVRASMHSYIGKSDELNALAPNLAELFGN